MDDYEVVAEELSQLAEKWRDLEERVAEVERVNARLEEAALTTARALGEVSRHWDAVYDAIAVLTGSTNKSRPSATTMRRGRVAPSQRIRGRRDRRYQSFIGSCSRSTPGNARYQRADTPAGAMSVPSRSRTY
jgi:hypothetical protein